MGRYEQQHVSLFIIQTKNTHIQEIMQVHIISYSRNRFGVCIIKPACRTIFHIQERSTVERHLPGGFFKDERKVGPKNVERIKLLNFSQTGK